MSSKLFPSTYVVSHVLGVTRSCYRETKQKHEPHSHVGIAACRSRLKNFDQPACLMVVAKELKTNAENTITGQVMDNIIKYKYITCS